MVLYTGDIGGSIVETSLSQDTSCNSTLLLDKNLEITCITVDDR